MFMRCSAPELILRLKMKKFKTWKDMKTFDDLVTKEERKLILKIEKDAKPEDRCPLIGKMGMFFHYCRGGYIPTENDMKPSPESEIYKNKVGCLELKNYCLTGYFACINYKSSQTK